MSFSAEFAACDVMYCFVCVVLNCVVVYWDFSVYLAYPEQCFYFGIIAALATWVFGYREVEFCSFNYLKGEAYKWCLDFDVCFLAITSLIGKIMNVCDPFRRDSAVLHRQRLEVSDSAAEGTLKEKGVFDFLKIFRYLRVKYFLQFSTI